MKRDRMCEHGTIEKGYSLELTYENKKQAGGGTVKATVEKKASFSYGCRMGDHDPDFWVNVLNFQRESEKIIKLSRKLMKAGTHIKLTFIASAYEDTPEYEDFDMFGKHKTTIKQVYFNEWDFDSVTAFPEGGMEQNAEDSEGGIYFTPDTRYTREGSDIWVTWQDGFIKSLAENGWAEHE